MRPLPDGIELREATRDDVALVTQFVRRGLRSYQEWAPEWTLPGIPPERRAALDEVFASGEAWILLAYEGDDLVGLVSISPRVGVDVEPAPPGTIRLWQMFVTPRLQGSGLAGALLDRALGEARRRGFDRMTLWAAEGAAQARRFYEREGWTLTRERADDSPFGLPIVQHERAT